MIRLSQWMILPFDKLLQSYRYISSKLRDFAWVILYFCQIIYEFYFRFICIYHLFNVTCIVFCHSVQNNRYDRSVVMQREIWCRSRVASVSSFRVSAIITETTRMLMTSRCSSPCRLYSCRPDAVSLPRQFWGWCQTWSYIFSLRPLKLLEATFSFRPLHPTRIHHKITVIIIIFHCS